MSKHRVRLGLAALAAFVAAAVAVVVTPTLATQPLRFHTPEIIGRLYLLERWATPVTVALTVAGAAIAAWLWRHGRWPVRVAATAAVALLASSTYFSRQHLVEWLMFAPAPPPAFVAVDDAQHVADGDLVLGVAGERAYPVRMAAYHHIIHDEIGGEAFVVTY